MESKELVDLTLAQQKQFDLVSFRVSWSQAVLFGCYEVRFLDPFQYIMRLFFISWTLSQHMTYIIQNVQRTVFDRQYLLVL